MNSRRWSLLERKKANIEDYVLDDFVVKNYAYWPSIKMEMRV